MNDAVSVSRVHAMYAVRLPQASATWDWLRGIEFVANARSPLVEAVQTLRAQFVQSGGADAPVCKFIQPLPGNRYKIILTRAQLERVIAEHYGVKACWLGVSE